jgi:hypothetical protein
MPALIFQDAQINQCEFLIKNKTAILKKPVAIDMSTPVIE